MIKMILPFNKTLKGGKGNGGDRAPGFPSFLFCCQRSCITPRWRATVINTIVKKYFTISINTISYTFTLLSAKCLY